MLFLSWVGESSKRIPPTYDGKKKICMIGVGVAHVYMVIVILIVGFDNIAHVYMVILFNNIAHVYMIIFSSLCVLTILRSWFKVNCNKKLP